MWTLKVLNLAINNMNIVEKSVGYKLETLGFDVFYDYSNNIFNISKLICKNCDASWFNELNQCIFCSSTFFYSYTCSNRDCLKTFSITMDKKKGNDKKKSTPTCDICNSILYKDCFNDDCISNKNTFIREEIINLTNEEGLFFNKSSFKISQHWCLKCGNNQSYYNSATLKVEVVNNINDLEKFKKNKIINNYIFYLLNNEKFLTITSNDFVLNELQDLNKYKDDLEIKNLKFVY